MSEWSATIPPEGRVDAVKPDGELSFSTDARPAFPKSDVTVELDASWLAGQGFTPDSIEGYEVNFYDADGRAVQLAPGKVKVVGLNTQDN